MKKLFCLLISVIAFSVFGAVCVSALEHTSESYTYKYSTYFEGIYEYGKDNRMSSVQYATFYFNDLNSISCSANSSSNSYTIKVLNKADVYVEAFWYVYNSTDKTFELSTNSTLTYKGMFSDYTGSAGHMNSAMSFYRNDTPFKYGFVHTFNFTPKLADGTAIDVINPNNPTEPTDDSDENYIKEIPPLSDTMNKDYDGDGDVDIWDKITGFFTWCGIAISSFFGNVTNFVTNFGGILYNTFKLMAVPSENYFATKFNEVGIAFATKFLFLDTTKQAIIYVQQSITGSGIAPVFNFTVMGAECNIDFTFLNPVIGIVRAVTGSFLVIGTIMFFIRSIPGFISNLGGLNPSEVDRPTERTHNFPTPL